MLILSVVQTHRDLKVVLIAIETVRCHRIRERPRIRVLIVTNLAVQTEIFQIWKSQIHYREQNHPVWTVQVVDIRPRRFRRISQGNRLTPIRRRQTRRPPHMHGLLFQGLRHLQVIHRKQLGQ